MTGGAGTRWYKRRERVIRELVLYAASPILIAIALVATFFPWTILLFVLVVGIVAKARPSK